MTLYAPNIKSTVSQSAIGEPSFAEVLAAIVADLDLNEQTRRFWCTSLRQMVKYLGMQANLVPARITAVGPKIAVLHPERLNVHPKTFANHRAITRKALNWYLDKSNNIGRKAPTADCFRKLLEQIDSRHHRDLLSPFFRYLTMEGIGQDSMCDAHVDGYVAFRQATSFKPLRLTQVRILVRYLNTYSQQLDGWPALALTEPPLARAHRGPAWEDLSDGLRRGIEAALDRRSKSRRSTTGKRLKPCKPATLERLRRQLLAFVRKADAIGIPVTKLHCLSALLHPDTVEPVLDAYWREGGDSPSSYTIELGDVLLGLARHDSNLDEQALERLRDIADTLAEYRRVGLTDKNRAVIREVLSGELWSKVLFLPRTLMAQANADARSQPVKAAVMAQLAVAIHLLSVAPVRMQNLASIEIGENLMQPRGHGTPYLLVFAAYDVKNQQALEFPLPEQTTSLIDTYIHNHRPVLMRGQNHDYLFPGKFKLCKDKKTLGTQISDLLYKRLGVKLTPHQFRHAAGAIILQHDPGNYETVRRVLGHTSIQTTTQSYIGLESLAAARRYGEIVVAMTPESQPRPIRGRR